MLQRLSLRYTLLLRGMIKGEKWAEPTPRLQSATRGRKRLPHHPDIAGVGSYRHCPPIRHASSHVPLSSTSTAGSKRNSRKSASHNAPHSSPLESPLPTTHGTTLCLPAKTANPTPAGLNLRAGAASRAAPRSPPPRGLARPLCYAHARRHCWAQALHRRRQVLRRRRRCRLLFLRECLQGRGRRSTTTAHSLQSEHQEHHGQPHKPPKPKGTPPGQSKGRPQKAKQPPNSQNRARNRGKRKEAQTSPNHLENGKPPQAHTHISAPFPRTRTRKPGPGPRVPNRPGNTGSS